MNRYLMTILTLSKNLTLRYFRDKTALFFTFVFPLIFLVVFGGIFGGGGSVNFSLALYNQSDSEVASGFVEQLEGIDVLTLEKVEDLEQARTLLGRGEYDAIVELPPTFGAASEAGMPTGTMIVHYDESRQQLMQALSGLMGSLLDGLNQQFVQTEKPFALEARSIQTESLTQFDYIFAGLLGFTLLSLGLFGLANTFPAEKKAGIFRRLRSTPLTPAQLILATALQYLLVGMLSIALMFVVGLVLFDFNMRGDYLSFILIMIIGTISMFGFGLAVSGWAKNENQAAPLANLVAFPMMFLSGVFFPRFVMPEWLQGVTTYVPLTPIVDGARQIITEGRTIFEIGPELAIIGVWTVIIYLIAAKTFRWE